jgi:GTP-binding protein
VVVYDMPGTTRDSIYIPMQRDEREYVLIDTAGVRKRGKITDVVEKFSVIKTLQAIEDANVVLLVIDAREGISDQDLSLLGFILNSGRSLVIVVNKWDGLSNEVREQVKETSTSVWALSTLPACTLSLRCTAAAWVTCSNPCAKRTTAPPVVRAPRC